MDNRGETPTKFIVHKDDTDWENAGSRVASRAGPATFITGSRRPDKDHETKPRSDKKKRNISTQRFKLLSIKLQEGSGEFVELLQDNDASIRLKVAKEEGGRKLVALVANMPTKEDPTSRCEVGFMEGVGGVRLGHQVYRPGEKEGGKGEARAGIDEDKRGGDGGRTKEGETCIPNDKEILEVIIKFDCVSYCGPRPPELSNPNPTDFAIMDTIFQRSEKFQESKKLTRLSITLIPYRGLLEFLKGFQDQGEVDIYAPALKRWWKDTAEYRRVLRAVAKGEYEAEKKDVETYYLQGLKAKFEKLEISFVELDKVKDNDMASTRGSDKNEDEEAEDEDAEDAEGEKRKREENRRREQKEDREKSVYRVVLQPGKHFVAKYKDGKRIRLEVQQGQKYRLRWKDPKGNFYRQFKGSVSAEDENITQSSPDIMISMIVCIPKRDFPEEVSSFSLIPCTDKTILWRVKRALKNIDEMPQNKPAAEIHRSFLFGERSLPMELTKETKKLHLESLTAAELDTFQVEAAHTALSHNFSIIQGPPGTGKSKTVIAMVAAYLQGRKPEQSRRILVTAPSNTAVNHLCHSWYKFVEDSKNEFFKIFQVVRFVSDGLYRPAEKGEVVDSDEDEDENGGGGAEVDLVLEMNNSKKGDFPAEYSMMRKRRLHDKWPDYEKLFLKILRGEYNPGMMQAFSEIRDDIDFDILSGVTILFTTCMGSGTNQVQAFFKPEFAIVDEAGQAAEAETSIPMAGRSMTQFVLVGDHQQLPPINTHNIPKLKVSYLERLAEQRSIAEEFMRNTTQVSIPPHLRVLQQKKEREERGEREEREEGMDKGKGIDKNTVKAEIEKVKKADIDIHVASSSRYVNFLKEKREGQGEYIQRAAEERIVQPPIQQYVLQHIRILQEKAVRNFRTGLETKVDDAIRKVGECTEFEPIRRELIPRRTMNEEIFRTEEKDKGENVEQGCNANNDAFGIKWVLLRKNYRSTAGIVEKVSRLFYNNLLEPTIPDPKNGDFFTTLASKPYPESYNLPPPVVMWQDVERNSEAQDSQTFSKYNLRAANSIIRLLQKIEALAPTIDVNDLAVISMYTSQVAIIKAGVEQHVLGRLKKVVVGTIDSFQGLERKYIILDMVRSNEGRYIGFLSNTRQFNVAISRAMEKLIIVGDLQMFSESNKFAFYKRNEALFEVAQDMLKRKDESVIPIDRSPSLTLSY
ncbi:hypothetical protein ABW20_dc0105570 [Dactylellina cionopaga]|nr:hypothetical protein ABW20_dc0105570 [Dactylellina cionopaga]